jgi:hypothetical protein
MNSKLTLAQVTGDDLAVDEEGKPAAHAYMQVLHPSPASKGIKATVISDAVQALLIMHGLQAQFVINYWRVTRRKEPGQWPVGSHARPGQKYRLTTGAGAEASFEEWQKVIKEFVGA